MKKIFPISVLLLIASPVSSADDAFENLAFSADIALTTNYVYRGVSLSEDQTTAKIYGFVDWGYKGIYLGGWASSIEQKQIESSEIGFYGGYVGNIGPLTYSLDYLYYDYPRSNDPLAFVEYGGSLSYTFEGDWAPIAKVYLLHSPDYFYETGNATVVEASLDFSLPSDIGLHFYVARQRWDEDYNAGSNGYNYYGIDATKTIGKYYLRLGFSDTNDEGEDWIGDSNRELVFTMGMRL